MSRVREETSIFIWAVKYFFYHLESGHPEPEDTVIDFELILKELDSQNKQKEKIIKNKQKQKKDFNKKFVKSKDQYAYPLF